MQQESRGQELGSVGEAQYGVLSRHPFISGVKKSREARADHSFADSSNANG